MEINENHLSLSRFLDNFFKVEEEVLRDYVSLYHSFHLPKKTIMTAPGDTERYWYFVASGIQKSYYLHQRKQHVIAFTYPPSFSGIPESFFSQKPSKYYLETVTDSTFLRIDHRDHIRYMEKHRPIETLFRLATEQFLIGVLERYYELMAYDIKTRFSSFVSRSPHLLQMVSQLDDPGSFVSALPVPVVFDHMGHVPALDALGDPGFQTLLRLLDTGQVWVKLSGAYRVTAENQTPYADVAPLARALIAANRAISSSLPGLSSTEMSFSAFVPRTSSMVASPPSSKIMFGEVP